jgi:hypothetical protein
MEYFNMEKFCLKKLNDVEGDEEYKDKISNGFAALESFNNGMNVSKA